MLLVLVYIVAEADSIYPQQINSQDDLSAYHESKLAELEFIEDYEVLHSTSNTVVIYPIFTQSAYQLGGFHAFYKHDCDECTTIEIQDYYKKHFAASSNGYRILELLSYEIIDDIDLDQNPEILQQYDKVILLHNEFVTKSEFKAITEHPNVIYLYPHALSSEITADYSSGTITLVRGPGYPDENIINGFDWEFDNTEYFDDWQCNSWEFYEVDNGHMLNCYPETSFPKYGHEILKTLKTL